MICAVAITLVLSGWTLTSGEWEAPRGCRAVVHYFERDHSLIVELGGTRMLAVLPDSSRDHTVNIEWTEKESRAMMRLEDSLFGVTIPIRQKPRERDL